MVQDDSGRLYALFKTLVKNTAIYLFIEFNVAQLEI